MVGDARRSLRPRGLAVHPGPGWSAGPAPRPASGCERGEGGRGASAPRRGEAKSETRCQKSDARKGPPSPRVAKRSGERAAEEQQLRGGVRRSQKPDARSQMPEKGPLAPRSEAQRGEGGRGATAPRQGEGSCRSSTLTRSRKLRPFGKLE